MSKTVIGVDIIEIARIERAVLRWQDSFLKRVYTEAELDLCHGAPSLAARFAAKEAVMKALGSGARGLSWRDIEIIANSDGVPWVRLHGRARRRSSEVGIADFSVTLAHSKQYAVAFVMGNGI
ncbi:MAG TPA: holo-[acyl-carrier-protein] synthase [Dehalococcoidia bacterium]|nr:holo-[acyl-carrier-protein] synthase [Dehalococcoidia bacterium]